MPISTIPIELLVICFARQACTPIGRGRAPVFMPQNSQKLSSNGPAKLLSIVMVLFEHLPERELAPADQQS